MSTSTRSLPTSAKPASSPEGTRAQPPSSTPATSLPAHSRRRSSRPTSPRLASMLKPRHSRSPPCSPRPPPPAHRSTSRAGPGPPITPTLTTSSTCCSKAAPSSRHLQDEAVRRKLAAAAQLTGPQRYLTYGKLDLEIARDAAPLIAYANPPEHEFFSARVGCQTYAFTDSTSPTSASDTRHDDHRVANENRVKQANQVPRASPRPTSLSPRERTDGDHNPTPAARQRRVLARRDQLASAGRSMPTPAAVRGRPVPTARLPLRQELRKLGATASSLLVWT